MPKSPNQKLKILYVMKMLYENTDDEHAMTMSQIIEELLKLDIKAERKSIYDDIEMLKNFGVYIETNKTKTTGYYVAGRTFQIPELKLLVDAVQCSKFITQKKSQELIKKLERLTSIHESRKLERLVYVTERVKNFNENIYYNIDKLHNAISENNKVTFKYFDYTITKERKYRKDGGAYTESPYALLWDDENYYLVTFSEKYQDYVHYRVDRMTDINILNDKRTRLPDNINFNAANYSKKFFNMYSGEEKFLELQFDNSLINVVIDRFGKDVDIRKKDDYSFIIRVNVSVSSTFYAWIFQFGNMVKILSPEDVKDSFKNSLKEIIKGY